MDFECFDKYDEKKCYCSICCSMWECIEKKTQNGLLIILHNLPQSARIRAELSHLIGSKKVNLNTVDENGLTLLMRLCRSNSDLDLVLKLIRVGADVNIKDQTGHTGLYYAIINQNKVIVKALLDNGADCFNYYFTQPKGFIRNLDLLQILIDLLDQPSIHFILNTNFLANTMLKYSPSNATLEIECNIPLMLYFSENLDFFQFLWNHQCNKISFKEENKISVLLCYLERCNIPINDWVNSLKVMLTSNMATKLMQQFQQLLDDDASNYTSLLFALLNVERSDRIELLRLWLSAGAPITISDIEDAMILFGYDEEVEFLIYNSEPEYFKFTQLIYLETNLICGSICQVDYKDIFSNYLLTNNKNLNNFSFNSWNFYDRRLHIIPFVFRNFTASFSLKKQLNDEKVWEIPDENLKLSPKFVPLLELSRNSCRKHIKEYFKPACPRDFFRIIDNLKVPDKMKDYLKLKPSPFDLPTNIVLKEVDAS